jgi:hypothetical protein
VAPRPHVLCGAALAVGLALGAPAACGGPARPPPLADEGSGAASPPDDAAPSFDFDAAPSVPTCNLGPEGGVCACADQPLLIDAPNIYFVLDRSGSMTEDNKWGTVQAVLRQIVVRLGPRANFGAAIFPATTDNMCGAGLQVYPPNEGTPVRGDAPAGTPGPTAAALLTVLGHVPAAGGTPTAATLQSLLPLLRSFPGKTYVILATDGGPNCNGAVGCTSAQCEPNIEGVAGCPVGGPPNCCDPPYGTSMSCLDGAPTTQAVSALAAAGIPVYVVGLPGSPPYAGLLDELAKAGGTARMGEPQYYAVGSADQGALAVALSKIAAKITASCTLMLNDAPPDASLVNVFLDEQVLPQDGPDGWTLSGQAVTILGASCARIESGDVLDVRVVAGCPTVLK